MSVLQFTGSTKIFADDNDDDIFNEHNNYYVLFICFLIFWYFTLKIE